MSDPGVVFDRHRLIEKTSIYESLQAALASERKRGTANGDFRASVQEHLEELFFPTIKRMVADSGAALSLSYRGPGLDDPDDQGEAQYRELAGIKDMATYSQVVEDNLRLYFAVLYRSGYRSAKRAAEMEEAQKAQKAQKTQNAELLTAQSPESQTEAGSSPVPAPVSAADPGSPDAPQRVRFQPRPLALPISQIDDLTLVGFGKRFPAQDDGSMPIRRRYSDDEEEL